MQKLNYLYLNDKFLNLNHLYLKKYFYNLLVEKIFFLHSNSLRYFNFISL